MIRTIILAGGALLAASTVARAQMPSLTFDQAVYVSCREAQGMQPEARKRLAIFLAEHSARHRGVSIPDDQRGSQLALLVRGGCTLAPDAYLFTVIDRAIVAEKDKLPRRQ
jgi:hypothetical protein